MNVLFIASNIPTPNHRNNKIILTIATKLSAYCNIEIIYPKPYVPVFIKGIKKYSGFYKLKDWQSNGRLIRTYTYPRLPGNGSAFRLFNSFFNRGVIKFHNDVKPDLVHAHFVFADGSLALRIKNIYNIPYVVTVRDYDARKIELLKNNSFDYKHARNIIENASSVLCLNHYQKNVIESNFSTTVKIIPHGIEKSEIIEPIQHNNSFVRVAVVCELIERKNVQWVIDAIKNYKGNSSIQLFVYGDGPLKEMLEMDCLKYDNIFIKGRVSRDIVLDELSKSDIFCLPSLRETFGLVYLEAAAKCNAIIGHHNDGVWELFEDGKEMLYAKSKSSFTSLLYKLVEDDELRNLLSISANKKVRDFAWKNISRRYYNNYQSVLKNV